ncbi:oligosaccharide flippase family protein [Candidatus Microgenomates bacterium]|nr:oligosaccharide flippase family protein [Candidatus Microgenomates bacterium]
MNNFNKLKVWCNADFCYNLGVGITAAEHLDASAGLSTGPTEEISLETVKRRAVKGVVALTGRTFILQVIALLATFLLTIFLTPTQFGVFFLVSAVINFFAYFSDIGLAAALIQKKDRLDKRELKSVFTVQQILVLGVIILIFSLTPLFQNWYKLSQPSVYLLWALTFSLFLSSLKTIPSVLLERELLFNKLIIPQIAETIVFYSIAVILAWQGFGITSFTVAVVARGIVGVVIIYILRPWQPGFLWNRQYLGGLLKFGLPYQANTMLAMVKDDGMTLVLGGIIGPAGIGLLGWAQKWAQAPLRFFMDQVIKVTFPAFSRMQHEKRELANAVSRSLFFICLLVFPALVGLVFVSEPLTHLIPKYAQWQPALLALAFISVNSAFAAVSTPLTNMLNSIGKIAVTFRLMVMWTVLTWIFVPLLASRYSINGAALGFMLVGISSIVAIVWSKRFVNVVLLESVGYPLTASIGMALVMFITGNLITLNWLGVIILVIVGLLSYIAMLHILLGGQIWRDFTTIYATFKKK